MTEHRIDPSTESEGRSERGEREREGRREGRCLALLAAVSPRSGRLGARTTPMSVRSRFSDFRFLGFRLVLLLFLLRGFVFVRGLIDGFFVGCCVF